MEKFITIGERLSTTAPTVNKAFLARDPEPILKRAKAQLDAWNAGSGYFYWSYKLLLDTVNEPNWIGWDAWDLGKCADQGWFPEV